MKSFVKKQNIFSLVFLVIFSLSFNFVSNFALAATNTSLDLTSEYSDNPSNDSDNNFQIVPKCAENGNVSCGWTELLQLVRNIMSLLLFLSASIAVLAFIYAGFLYLTAFGDMGKVEQAHGIFSKVIIGFLFVFLGWLIVFTILKVVGIEEGFYLINIGSGSSSSSSSWW